MTSMGLFVLGVGALLIWSHWGAGKKTGIRIHMFCLKIRSCKELVLLRNSWFLFEFHQSKHLKEKVEGEKKGEEIQM